MRTPKLTVMKKNGLTAMIGRREGSYLYSVFDPEKGTIASGWRETEAAAVSAATLVLKSRKRRRTK